MKLTMTVLGLAVLALILAILNVHVLDYDAASGGLSYHPRLVEFGFDFTTMTIKSEQVHNPLFLGTIALAIAALLFSPAAYFKEKDGPVCLLVGGIAVIAILWQLFVLAAIAGLVLGIALTVAWHS